MLTLLKNLFCPSDRRQPQYDLNDPRHPVNAGWRRVDVSTYGTRPIRFQFIAPAYPATGARSTDDQRARLHHRNSLSRVDSG